MQGLLSEEIGPRNTRMDAKKDSSYFRVHSRISRATLFNRLRAEFAVKIQSLGGPKPTSTPLFNSISNFEYTT